MRSLESRVAEAAIRFYRWVPPRTKRCPHSPGCSELALAAAQCGQGFAEVLRIVGTCKGDKESTPSLALAPLLFLLALLPLSVARNSCPPMMQMCDDMECVSIGSPCKLDPWNTGISKQWGSRGHGGRMPCLGINSLNPPCGGTMMGGAPHQWGSRGRAFDHGTGC